MSDSGHQNTTSGEIAKDLSEERLQGILRALGFRGDAYYLEYLRRLGLGLRFSVEEFEWIAAAIRAGWSDSARASAGDLYLAALDEWFTHCLGCNADTCETCAVVLNQARLARKVWASSAHKKVTAGV
jgi:hypothetical protein